MRIACAAEDLADCKGCGLVPTMGALHEGHVALVRRAREIAPQVVVSIFVNPTQFGHGEDVDRYPRSLEDDLEACRAEAVDVVFCPSPQVVYPPNHEIDVPPLPRVALQPGLEDTYRPEHFSGVCQVVARLFDLVKPAVAVFGEKDYQQLLVIREMVAETPQRFVGLRIEGHPTVRDPDGIAASSRNRNLAPSDRPRALALVAALDAARAAWAAPRPDPASVERCMHGVLTDAGLDIDYAVVRDAGTLEPLEDSRVPARALVAARVGGVRLIDNISLDIQ